MGRDLTTAIQVVEKLVQIGKGQGLWVMKLTFLTVLRRFSFL
jgi:hypothetical protein